MLDFTWKMFLQTGNIDMYLLFKELEKANQDIPDTIDFELVEEFPFL